MFNILIYGLSVAFVGILTVFAALVILIGLIKGMEKVIARMNAGDINLGSVVNAVKSRVGKKEEKATPIVIDTTAMGNDELVAVITAAIATVLESEAAAAGTPEEKKEKPTFVVRSIRRISSAPAWNRAGREKQVYSRM